MAHLRSTSGETVLPSELAGESEATRAARRARGRFADQIARARDRYVFASVFATVLLTRLPFLDAGYGATKDAWRVAHAARLTSTTHEYWASRFPPHPVHELATTLIWRGGAVATNLATAAMASAGLACFAVATRRLGMRRWLPMTLALALVPQVYIASVTTIDYLWALAFVFAALLLVTHDRVAVAGVMLGFAVGARITSALALVPLALLLPHARFDRATARRVAVLTMGTALVGAALLAPAVWRYGGDTFTFADIADRRVGDVARKATLDTWGVLGTVAIAAACLYRAARVWPSRPMSRPTPVLLAATSGWVIFLVAFVRLPHLAAYLIPAIPFVLMTLHELIPGRAFLVACAALVLAPFLGADASGPKAGAIFDDRSKRSTLMRDAKRIVEAGNGLPGRNVVVAGEWRAPVSVYSFDLPDRETRYVHLLNRYGAAEAIRRGERLYYVPGEHITNLRYTRFDLRTAGARPLPMISFGGGGRR